MFFVPRICQNFRSKPPHQTTANRSAARFGKCRIFLGEMKVDATFFVESIRGTSFNFTTDEDDMGTVFSSGGTCGEGVSEIPRPRTSRSLGDEGAKSVSVKTEGSNG